MPNDRDIYLNLTIDNSINLVLTPSSMMGTFSTASIDFNAKTNYISGYKISIKSPVAGDTHSKLINNLDPSKTIDSIPSTISETSFLNLGNTQYNNKWWYRPSKLNSADNNNFLPSPDNLNETVLNVTNCANESASCPSIKDDCTIELGVRANNNMAAGIYSNTFNITAVANPIAGRYRVIYDGNGATAGSMTALGTEITHDGINIGKVVVLYAPNYKKDGYGFVGWSPSPTTTVGGSAPIYGPNETITAPSYIQYGVNNRVTLYAIWMAKDTTDTMQTFLPPIPKATMVLLVDYLPVCQQMLILTGILILAIIYIQVLQAHLFHS